MRTLGAWLVGTLAVACGGRVDYERPGTLICSAPVCIEPGECTPDACAGRCEQTERLTDGTERRRVMACDCEAGATVGPAECLPLAWLE